MYRPRPTHRSSGLPKAINSLKQKSTEKLENKPCKPLQSMQSPVDWEANQVTFKFLNYFWLSKPHHDERIQTNQL
jgi:hypothetical protein